MAIRTVVPTELNAEIDRLLRERRPDRYDSEAGTGWLDEVAAEIEPMVEGERVVRRLASQLVRSREAVATRKANKLMRDISRSVESGEPLMQEAIDWMMSFDWPLSIPDMLENDQGKMETVTTRVALRALTSDDLRLFALRERQAADKDYAARAASCKGAEWVASQMDSANAVNLREWVENFG